MIDTLTHSATTDCFVKRKTLKTFSGSGVFLCEVKNVEKDDRSGMKHFKNIENSKKAFGQ